MATHSIGFVGIGNMGVPMVHCLARAGHSVGIYDLDRARCDLAAQGHDGIQVLATPSAVATAPIIITMLPDSRIVRAAIVGDDGVSGIAAALAPGSLVVDMSSSFAPDTVALGRDLAKRGVALVDAPVSGGVGKAVSGTLAIMAGGQSDDVTRAAVVLAAMGTVHRTGGLGSGHAAKALNNYVSAAGLIATCEALLVGRAFGLDPKTLVQVLNASTGRNNTTENKALRYLIPEQFDSGFALALMRKDVAMARALSTATGQSAEELAFVSAYLDRASAALGPDADHTAVMAFASAGKG